MTLYQIIKALQSASGSNAKLAIMQEHKDNELFKEYMKAVYDPSINYYQTKIKPYVKRQGSYNNGTFEGIEDEGDDSHLLQVFELIKRTLSNRVKTGNEAVHWLSNISQSFGSQSKELLELLIKRSIGAGIGDTMVLKTWPDLFFSVPYMRCSLMDDKIKAKFNKLDNIFIQKKADGSFCYLVKEAYKAPEAITRAGSKYPLWFASELAEGLPDGFVWVGELEVFENEFNTHGPDKLNLLNRQTGNGLLNSVLKSGEELDDKYSIKLTAWDLLTVEEFKAGISTVPYKDRLSKMYELYDEYNPAGWWSGVDVIETASRKTLDEAYKIYSEFTAAGFEGAVIKNPDGIWKNGTSKDQVKLKIEFEAEYQVIGMTEGTGKAKGTMGSLTIESSDGKIRCDVGTGFTDEMRKEWWNENVKSKPIVTVKANDIISNRENDTYSLFLPVFVEERLDKTEANSYSEILASLEAAKHGG